MELNGVKLVCRAHEKSDPWEEMVSLREGSSTPGGMV